MSPAPSSKEINGAGTDLSGNDDESGLTTTGRSSSPSVDQELILIVFGAVFGAGLVGLVLLGVAMHRKKVAGAEGEEEPTEVN